MCEATPTSSHPIPSIQSSPNSITTKQPRTAHSVYKQSPCSKTVLTSRNHPLTQLPSTLTQSLPPIQPNDSIHLHTSHNNSLRDYPIFFSEQTILMCWSASHQMKCHHIIHPIHGLRAFRSPHATHDRYGCTQHAVDGWMVDGGWKEGSLTLSFYGDRMDWTDSGV